MSPNLHESPAEMLRFPRVSGDEPTRLGVATRISKFSPREWG